MPDHMTSLNQSATLMIVTLLAFGLRPCFSLCETRCEQSIPSLYRLRAYWSRSFKRIGEQRISFEQFLLSLVQESDSEDEVVRRLRASVLRMIGRYQDCVMACEHQFSKRSGRSRARGQTLQSLSKTPTFSSGEPFLHHFLPNHRVLLSQSGRRISHVT